MTNKTLIQFLLIFWATHLMAQENAVSLSGGYAFSTIEDTDVKATGFRINGTYEYNALGGNFSHGVSFGYIHLTAEEGLGALSYTSTINSFPIYYAPKYSFGNEKIKGFVKGALGTQFASLEREGAITFSDGDFGFYGGGGGGLTYFVKENLYLNAEYEIAWASNSWYKDGWMNSIMGGIGFRF